MKACLRQSTRRCCAAGIALALCALLALLSPSVPAGGRAGALPALLETAVADEPPTDRELLWPGRTAAREISPGQTHLYIYVLQANEYLRLSVTASDTGLRASLSDPEGRALAQTACGFDEDIRLSWVAGAAGEYQIRLETCEAEPAAGGYELRAEGGAATREERVRVAAESQVVEAERLRAEFSEATSAEALRRYEAALAVWREAGDRTAEAETLCDIGEVLRERGQRTAALARLEEALEAAGPAGDTRLRGRILNELGILRALMGDYEAALSACERALALGRDGADWRNEALALSNIGWVHYDRDELRKSQEYQRAALRIWQERGERRAQATSLLRTGYVDAVLGETTEAFAAYERARLLFRAIGDQRGQSLVLTAVGHLHAMTGERQEALDSYDQAVALSRPMEDSELTAQLCSGIGYVHHELGEFQKALEYRTQALELYRALPDRWGEASLHTSIGVTYGAMGREKEALEHYRRGLAIARSIGNGRLEASLLREMGAAHERLGDTREALSHYEKSLALSRSGANPRSESSALNHIGHVHAGRGRHREALAHFRRALALARAIHDRFSESLTLFNIARSQRDLGLLDDSRTHVEAAVGLVESLRTNVASQELRTSYFATARQHYELYIDVLMRLRARGPSAELDALAFEVSERARARSLLETLAGSRDAIRQGVDPEVVGRERALRRQLNAKAERLVRVLGRPHTSEEAEALAAEVAVATGKHAAVEAEIRVRSPLYAALTQPEPLGIGEIQRRVLDNETLLLEYALGDERSYVWAVTRAGVTGYELPGRAHIEEAARRLYGLLTARQGVPGETAEQYRERAARSDADYQGEADALGDMILGPVAGHLTEGRRVLVVADGALQYIPFGALTTPGAAMSGAGEDGQRQSGAHPSGGDGERAPLFTRHEVVSLPSASILPALQGKTAGREPTQKRSVAVFADPVFDKDDPRVRPSDSSRPKAEVSQASADALMPQSTPEVHRAIRDASALFSGEGVPRLLASREEAEAIAAALPSGEVEKVTGFGASRAAAVEPGLGRHRVIHFATHGILDSERPEMSGIVLSLVNEQGEPQDGFLSLQDIYNLDLSADLVVLSACNTALGREVRGEGLIGLTRGFMYAGAGAVVASLWKVDDEATAELMKHFYAGMFQRGLAPPAALRQAQLAMWRQKRWRAPYYWAAFVIQGQYGELKGMGEKPSVLAQWGLAAWGGGAAAISFAALGAIRLRRRRRNSAGAR